MQGGQLRAAPDVRAHLLDLDSDLIYQETLGSYKLFKVINGVHERIGKVVVKMFLRADGPPNDKQLLAVKDRLVNQKKLFNFQAHPNVLPYQDMDVTDRAAVILRPYFPCHLYHRIMSRPFLDHSQRFWLAFQAIVQFQIFKNLVIN